MNMEQWQYIMQEKKIRLSSYEELSSTIVQIAVNEYSILDITMAIVSMDLVGPIAVWNELPTVDCIG
jgi:hypothetical protein